MKTLTQHMWNCQLYAWLVNKKGLLLFEIDIGCGNVQIRTHLNTSGSGHCLNCTSLLPREPDFPRVTIFIVDFIFFYVTIYSLSLSEW